MMEKVRSMRHRLDLALKFSLALVFLFFAYEFFVHRTHIEVLERHLELERNMKRVAQDRYIYTSKEKKVLSDQIDHLKLTAEQMTHQFNDQLNAVRMEEQQQCKESTYQKLSNFSAKMNENLNEKIASDRKVLELTDTVSYLKTEVGKWKYQAETCLQKVATREAQQKERLSEDKPDKPFQEIRGNSINENDNRKWLKVNRFPFAHEQGTTETQPATRNVEDDPYKDNLADTRKSDDNLDRRKYAEKNNIDGGFNVPPNSNKTVPSVMMQDHRFRQGFHPHGQ